MKRTAFIENHAQVEALITDPNGLQGVELWVALTAQAMFALESRGIPYQRLDQYLEPETIELEDKKAVEKLKVFYHQSKTFAELVQKHDGLVIDVGGYQLRRWVSQIELSLYALSVLIERECPDEIIFVSEKSSPNIDVNDQDQLPDLYQRCLRFLSLNKKIPIREISCINERNIPGSRTSKSGISSLKRLKAIIRKDIKFLIDQSRFPKNLTDNGILFLSLAYDLEFLARRLIKTSSYPIYLYNCSLNPPLDQEPEILKAASGHFLGEGGFTDQETILTGKVNAFWEELQASEWFRETFSWNGINYYELIKDRLRVIFRDNILKLNLYYHKHLDILQRYKISLIVTPYVKNNPIATSLWNAAEKLGINIVVFQHGGGYGYNYSNDLSLFEFNRKHYFFSYGEGMKDYLRLEDISFQNVIPVGSLKLNYYRNAPHRKRLKFRRALLEGNYKKLVTIAPTTFIPSWRFPVVPFLLCRSFSFEKRLLDVCSQFKDIRFVIKLSRSDTNYNPIKQYVESINLSNFVVFHEPLLIEYLQASDLALIIEELSTKFIEALSLGVPMCVFSFPWIKIFQQFKNEFEKSLFFSTDEDDFMVRVQKRLQKLDRGENDFNESLDPYFRKSILIDEDSVPEKVDKALKEIWLEAQ